MKKKNNNNNNNYEMKYLNFANWVRLKIKSIRVLLNIAKITQCMLIKACIYVVVPQ